MTLNISPAPITKNLIGKLTATSKIAAKSLNIYEDEKHFAEVRFTQDLLVNLTPKIPFARSVADLSETSFLEIAENFLVYYGGNFLNENLFKKILLSKATPELKAKVETSAIKLVKEGHSDETKKAISLKAALAVCGLAIPLAEYSLSYIKNLFTIKLFKQADFNNIANLKKDKKEDPKLQEKVKESAKKHIKLAGGIFAGCLGFATLLATKGKKSGILQSISEFILTPGNKLFKNNHDKAELINKYFSLDPSQLGRGQLVTCVTAGFAGYAGAAKDRGKQNLLEVLYRFPLVGFYVITGSEMFEAGFKSILKKNGSCKELLDEEASNKKINKQKIKLGDEKNIIKNEMPKLSELNTLAYKLAGENKTEAEVEAIFKKLFKQKLTIIGIPMVFSLVVMGLFVAGISRFFTQYRYNKEIQTDKA